MQELRTGIVQALRDSGVFTLRERGLEERFASGDVDVRMDELEMDSLAVMEFCIAVETHWGLPLSPEQLTELGTLEQVTELIAAHAAT